MLPDNSTDIGPYVPPPPPSRGEPDYANSTYDDVPHYQNANYPTWGWDQDENQWDGDWTNSTAGDYENEWEQIWDDFDKETEA